jgi:hypothetical protein
VAGYYSKTRSTCSAMSDAVISASVRLWALDLLLSMHQPLNVREALTWGER